MPVSLLLANFFRYNSDDGIHPQHPGQSCVNKTSPSNMGGRGRRRQIRRRQPSKIWRTISPTPRPAALQRQGQLAVTNEHASKTRRTCNKQAQNLRTTPHVKILSLMSKFTEEQTSTKNSYRGVDLDQKQERETSMGGSSSIKTPTPTPKQPRQSHHLFMSPEPKAKRDR